DAGGLELLREPRTDARGPQLADHLTVDVGGLLEDEHVLQDDRVALHALDLGDVDDLARAVLEARDLDDQIERARDLLTDSPRREVDAGHKAPRLEPREDVAPRLRVARRERADMSARHDLDTGARRPALRPAHDDPPWPPLR